MKNRWLLFYASLNIQINLEWEFDSLYPHKNLQQGVIETLCARGFLAISRATKEGAPSGTRTLVYFLCGQERINDRRNVQENSKYKNFYFTRWIFQAHLKLTCEITHSGEKNVNEELYLIF